VSVTHIDSLVLARSAFHHSVNYRCVILYGQATKVTDADEKMQALRLVVEHTIPGRWKDVRWPNTDEFRQTLVVKLPITEGSAKIRATGVIDDEADMGQGCWAGLMPIRTTYGPPVPDAALPADIPLPSYLESYTRTR
jgi:nitroimidazol reductase NimA-like FMN-containing flavoprotein (pyridoxamine 5'-phosphate oxidase superfamily)